MSKLEVCAGCRRSPLGVFKPVKKIGGRMYCLTCASAMEDGPNSEPHLAQGPQQKSVTPGATRNPPDAPRYYCTQCHTRTNTARMKGNGWIEFLLYFCYIVPGIIYSVWRRTGPPNSCPTCGHDTLILAQAMEPTTETHVKCPECAELVRREARKCKHCGSALAPQ